MRLPALANPRPSRPIILPITEGEAEVEDVDVGVAEEEEDIKDETINNRHQAIQNRLRNATTVVALAIGPINVLPFPTPPSSKLR